MRAIRFEADGSIQPVNLPMPTPGAEEVLVQVLAAGVCRTDLHTLEAVKHGQRPPVVPGHEIAGKVSKVGSDVYMINPGDLVAVHYEQPCGTCRHCRRKRTNLCKEGHSLGFDVPGGYAEYVAVKQNTVLPLPQDYDPALAAPLSCSGATAYHAVVAVGDATEEELVVVIGAGGVGLSAIQIAKAQGARVVAVDVRPEAQKAAVDAGADSAATPEEAAQIRDADVVIDFVSTAATLGLGRTILGVGGRFVVVASGQETVPLSAADIMEGGRAYLGSYSTTMADLARALALAENGKLTPVVTRRASLGEAAEVLRDLESGMIVGRAVLIP
ncbi:MAG TPA: alcohol dehydrogenase catalytic domain-containing protein [Thermoplasmata archaeon]|nr:alcohol dehydrogenase catalytic domain-containing protein [Thermoplasmata archaeon]